MFESLTGNLASFINLLYLFVRVNFIEIGGVASLGDGKNESTISKEEGETHGRRASITGNIKRI